MPDARKIVVVEDAFVRSFLRAALERQGHHVVCAVPAHAAELLESGDVDLLVTNTPQTFADFGGRIPLLYLAAFPDPAAAVDFTRWLSLRKPFQTTELVGLVQQLLETE
jgi:CheY-like chemotaxis protein